MQAILAWPLKLCPNQIHLSWKVPRAVCDYKNYEIPIIKKVTTVLGGNGKKKNNNLPLISEDPIV